MHGSVYVKVKADAASPMLMEAGGSTGMEGEGETQMGVRISWKNPGGITGNGWTLHGHTIDPEGKTQSEINHAVREAASGMTLIDLMAVGSCVVVQANE